MLEVLRVRCTGEGTGKGACTGDDGGEGAGKGSREGANEGGAIWLCVTTGGTTIEGTSSRNS
jgi:hypothetical protein